MPRRQRIPKDANTTAAKLVQAVTGSEPVNGEDLIGDPATRAKFLEAKRQYAAKRTRPKPLVIYLNGRRVVVPREIPSTVVLRQV